MTDKRLDELTATLAATRPVLDDVARARVGAVIHAATRAPAPVRRPSRVRWVLGVAIAAAAALVIGLALGRDELRPAAALPGAVAAGPELPDGELLSARRGTTVRRQVNGAALSLYGPGWATRRGHRLIVDADAFIVDRSAGNAPLELRVRSATIYVYNATFSVDGSHVLRVTVMRGDILLNCGGADTTQPVTAGGSATCAAVRLAQSPPPHPGDPPPSSAPAAAEPPSIVSATGTPPTPASGAGMSATSGTAAEISTTNTAGVGEHRAAAPSTNGTGAGISTTNATGADERRGAGSATSGTGAGISTTNATGADERRGAGSATSGTGAGISATNATGTDERRGAGSATSGTGAGISAPNATGERRGAGAPTRVPSRHGLVNHASRLPPTLEFPPPESSAPRVPGWVATTSDRSAGTAEPVALSPAARYAAAERLMASDPTAARTALIALVTEAPSAPEAAPALLDLARLAAAAGDPPAARSALDTLAVHPAAAALALPAAYLRCTLEPTGAGRRACLTRFRAAFPNSLRDPDILAYLAVEAARTGDCPAALPLLDEYARRYATGRSAAVLGAWRTHCARARP